MSEYAQALTVFLAQAVVISLSGVMAPGAITAATLAAGTRSRHAGAMIAVGHGIVEFPLMIAVMGGMGVILSSHWATIGIGMAGGLILLWMAAGMIRSSRGVSEAAGVVPRRGPIMTGVLLSAGNPYFLLWWATIGLRLSMDAMKLGVAAFALFAVVHWLCDLVWLEALTQAAFRGAKLLGGRLQQVVLAFCGVAMAILGGRFLYVAVAAVWADL